MDDFDAMMALVVIFQASDGEWQAYYGSEFIANGRDADDCRLGAELWVKAELAGR